MEKSVVQASTDWDGTPHWEKEPEVAQKYITYIDPAVQSMAKELLSGVAAQRITPHGVSFWTRTGRIVAVQEGGSRVFFFLKLSIGDDGKGMMHGEYESMKALHETLPDLVPQPIAWGTYETDPDIHFFICTFCDMKEGLCSLDEFPKLVVALHEKGVSPTGKLGFPVTTYQGLLPQDPTWCDTWEECFSRNIDIYFEHELRAQGPDEEIAELRDTIMTREGNAGTDRATNVPKIFDACSWYAHNEFEMAPWSPARQKMDKTYVDAYLKHFPKAEPEEDFDGRNALYALRFNLCSSGLYPGNLNYRNVVRMDMRELVDRYPESFEEWQKRQTIPSLTRAKM
ncbi:Uu.00g017700.m01.CDS01 [Anthostomella pinea]|uniref:protein-ribulosamine 3-kinase n=1 Tax=Anthostomella pinea TaxID=933095 RepID=A0AAI8VZ01_9PEZI|nr:Uu.00g017700.m01.CDS01 [Anthostomella pinea]